MKKSYSLELIILPIIFIIISIVLVTTYNIYALNDYKENQIKNLTEDFILKEKEHIYKKVHYLINTINVRKSQVEKKLKNEIKFKILEAHDLSTKIYNQYKNRLTQQEIQDIIKMTLKNEIFSNKNNYYFIIDLTTNKLIMHKNEAFENFNLTQYHDSDGLNILAEQKSFLKKGNSFYQVINFPKPNSGSEEFLKLLYLKKFESYNWLIGTGAYFDDMQEHMQKRVLETFSMIRDNYNDLSILQLHNINGGEGFATVLLDKNHIEEVNEKISTDKENKLYFDEVLEKLKLKSEAYITYDEIDSLGNKKKKTSYVYYDRDWNWIICSGFYFDNLNMYIDNIKSDVEKKASEYVIRGVIIIIFFSLIMVLTFYFISHRINKTLNNYSKELETTNDKLLLQKDMFKALFEKSTDGIFLLDTNAIVKDCNESIVEIFGYSNKYEMIGLSFLDFSPKIQPDESLSYQQGMKYIENCLEQTSIHFEWLHLKRNGTKLWCDISFTKIIIKDEIFLHVVLRDINERKRLEKVNKRQERILSQQSKLAAMGEMIGNIAHQWRQPLSMIATLASGIKLQKEYGLSTEAEEKSQLDKITSTVQHLSETIDDFRDFFNPDKTETTEKIEDVLLHARNLVDAQFSCKNIHIIEDIDEINFTGLNNELVQVLINILNNSRDALELIDSSKRYIFINAYILKDNIVIKIKDNAGGIEGENLTRVFEPYFTTKYKAQGTGIGLYMSEEIIARHMYGSIEVNNVEFFYETKKYVGAEFTITLPLKKSLS